MFEIKNKKYKVIDLFSGCGGMSLGFKWGGFDSILAADIDVNAMNTFLHNFPTVSFINKDLSSVEKQETDNIVCNNNVDLIIGGPPCQGFSLANKKRNKINDDPRNKLFYEFVKFVEWYMPKAFVMENVKGLLSMKKGEVIETILMAFSDAGYDAEYKILKSSDFGVPQARERVFIIGYRKDLGIKPKFPKRNILKDVTVNDAISDLPLINSGEGKESSKYTRKPKSEYQKFMRNNSKVVKNHISMRHTPRLIARFKAIKNGQSLVDVWDEHGAVTRGDSTKKSSVKFSQNNYRVYGDKPSPTIAASFQSNFIHPSLDRNFTAREGARLQSFPDTFEFKGMRTKMSWEKGLSQYQQIGNAVPPLMAKAIADVIFEELESIVNN